MALYIHILIRYTEITEILTQNTTWRLTRYHIASQISMWHLSNNRPDGQRISELTKHLRVEDFTGSKISLSASHR